jgi:hypothetical protein
MTTDIEFMVQSKMSIKARADDEDSLFNLVVPSHGEVALIALRMAQSELPPDERPTTVLAHSVPDVLTFHAPDGTHWKVQAIRTPGAFA